MKPLNLAARPFRNEALPALLLGLAAVALVTLTVAHGLAVRRLHSAAASARQQEVAAFESELARLQSEARELRPPRPSVETLAEWAVLKDLVDRRTFSWTVLFSQLEAVLPPDIRLVSVTPRVRHGRLELELAATARSTQAGLQFMRTLEAADAFEDVYPPRLEPSPEGGKFTYSMTYRAPAAPAESAGAPPPAAPPPEAAHESPPPRSAP